MSTQIDRQADTQTERCVQFNNTFAEATLYSNIWPIDALSWFTVRNHFRFQCHTGDTSNLSLKQRFVKWARLYQTYMLFVTHTLTKEKPSFFKSFRNIYITRYSQTSTSISVLLPRSHSIILMEKTCDIEGCQPIPNNQISSSNKIFPKCELCQSNKKLKKLRENQNNLIKTTSEKNRKQYSLMQK